MTTRRSVLAGLALVGLAPATFAHRAARAETDVRVADDGAVRVIHSFHSQDVQDALFGAGLLDAPDMSSLRARAKLALYTSKHFSIAQNDAPVALEIIGAEIEGRNVYVYQTGRLPRPEAPLQIGAGMLHELVNGQVNSVNVARNGKTVTLDFAKTDGMKSID